MICDRHEDCRRWQLTNIQCMRHHARLARHYGERAKWHADKALRLARIVRVLAFISIGAALLTFVLRLVTP